MKLNRQEFASEEGRFEFEPRGSMGIVRRSKLRRAKVSHKKKALHDHRRGQEVRA